MGDFNSHNQMWGYKHNEFAENLLLEWMTLNIEQASSDIPQGQRNVQII
jgi:hypothetical protein